MLGIWEIARAARPAPVVVDFFKFGPVVRPANQPSKITVSETPAEALKAGAHLNPVSTVPLPQSCSVECYGFVLRLFTYAGVILESFLGSVYNGVV